MQNFVRSIALVSAVGCVSMPPAALLENAQRVAVLSQEKPSRVDLHARGRIASALRGAGSATAEAIGMCANAGGEGDFAGIALMLCLGLAAIIGGLGGGVVGASQGLPADAVRSLNQDLEAFLDDRDLNRDFVGALAERIGSQRSVSADDPDLVLSVRLAEVRLRQHTGRRLSVALAASVELAFTEPSWAGRRYTRSYRYETPRGHVDRWLDAHGAHVAEQIRAAFAGLSEEIVRDLWRPVRRGSPRARPLRRTPRRSVPSSPGRVRRRAPPVPHSRAAR